jgi:hypothetical protein
MEPVNRPLPTFVGDAIDEAADDPHGGSQRTRRIAFHAPVHRPEESDALARREKKPLRQGR